MDFTSNEIILIEVITTSLIVVVALIFRDKNAYRQLKHPFLFLLLFVLLAIIIRISYITGTPELHDIRFLALLVFLFFLIFNRHIVSLFFIVAGSFLNFIVIALNNGNMVVSPEKLAETGMSLTNNYALMTASTKLNFLGDRFYFSSAGGIFSLGDVLIIGGLAGLVIQYLILRWHKNSKEITIGEYENIDKGKTGSSRTES